MSVISIAERKGDVFGVLRDKKINFIFNKVYKINFIINLPSGYFSSLDEMSFWSEVLPL